LPGIIEKQGPETLAAQRVPTDVSTLTVDAYREFLANRREALADCMNAFIEKKAGS
jgi:hypothetical protein